ncbi:hypothetical protein AURDEDRAFT_175418 [Auricularia subglabra TFB-10046 SS5]|uniref:MYND-type domain-containing protein n=1 Tax=Auricularia subglabra (strain TFB-10046 / SS5) TaxID=717982 RepID=J0D8E8_AURST|nr:hypothetical protein AURDEDRAFT_175418 [Auricularia subglabra TFB-10046 SS5]
MSTDSLVVTHAEQLAAGFLPSHAPTVCPTCLSRFIYSRATSRKGHTMQANMVVLQYRCHVFWDAVVSFAMREWTPGARTLINRRMRENRAQCLACATDIHWGMCGCDYFRHLLDSCCTALYLCLKRHPSPREAAYCESFVRWPPSPDLIFPFGASRAIRALLPATKMTRYAHHLLTYILESAGDLVLPILSEESVRQQLVAAIFGKLAKTAERLAMQSADCDKDLRLTQLTSDDDIYDLVLAICCRDMTEDGIQASLLRGYTLELYNAVCKVLVLADDDGPRLARNNLAYLASGLWTALPASEKVERPQFLQEVDDTSIALLKDPYRNLQNMLHRVRLQKHCYSPTCSGTVDTRRKVLKCGKCRLVQYCSQECQKEDWSSGLYPHRAICDMLHELFVFTTLEATGEEFSAACVENEFPLERVDQLIAWSGGPEQDYAHGAPHLDRLTQAIKESGLVQCDFTAYQSMKR